MIDPIKRRAPGGGRKTISPDGALVRQRAIKLTDTDWATFREIGGVEWLRAMIAAARNH
jgi:hypothetical protein